MGDFSDPDKLRQKLDRIEANIGQLMALIQNQPGVVIPQGGASTSERSSTGKAQQQQQQSGKKAIYDHTGFPIAEYSSDENSIRFRDGIYIKEDNKLLLADPKEISQNLVSPVGGKTTRVKVSNKTGEVVYAFWIDYEGKPQWRGKVPVGAEWGQETPTGVPFVFTNTAGKPLGTLTVDGEGNLFELRK